MFLKNEDNCKKALSDVNEDELNEELSSILSQMAYCQHNQGQTVKPKQIYEKLLAQKYFNIFFFPFYFFNLS